MIISVINRTKTISREEVQNVIRAISRQLTEDFKPYWHKEVILRLERFISWRTHKRTRLSSPR